MKPLVLATAFLATGWAFGAGVDLELRSAKPQQLVLESPELRVFLVNRGKEPVSIALTAGSEPTLRIETGDGWLECRNVLIVCAGVGDVRRIRIDPGGEVDMGAPPLDCPTAAMDGHADVKAWVDVPGRYRLQAESRLEPPAQSAGDTAEPGNTFTGVVTSNTVSIEVTEPSGIDAQALTWAREHNDSPLSWRAVKLFPSSYYAALALLPYLDIGKADPGKVRTEIEGGRFLAWGSVPDSDTCDGWASLSGAELAGWRIERAERILRDHPKFAGLLKLAIGVNQIAAGNASDGRRLLRHLASHPDTPEGKWARLFLGGEGP